MAFVGDWKVISKAPHFHREREEIDPLVSKFHSERNRKENDIPTSKLEFASLPGPLAHVHEHIAGLERALYDEVDRRVTSENEFRDQLEMKIRIATDKLADVTETEMARMYRRIEADVMNRIESLTIEVRKMSSSLTQMNRQIESVSGETRENRERIHRMEQRFGLLIDGEQVSSSSQVKDAAGLRESAKNEVELVRRMNDLTAVVSTRVVSRIDAIEEWLQGNLTPEILRIVDSVKAEQLQREEHDQEIMDVVRQYSKIIQEHFDPEAREAAP